MSWKEKIIKANQKLEQVSLRARKMSKSWDAAFDPFFETPKPKKKKNYDPLKDLI